MKALKILIISYWMYPDITPRSFRATELAKELVRQGHNITLCGVMKDNVVDYKKFTDETGVKVKNLSSSNFIYGKNFFEKAFRRLTNYPFVKLIPQIKKTINSGEYFDYLITIAAPHAIHWGASFASKDKYKCWVADCGDPFMGNPLAFNPFYFKWLEKKWCKMANFISVPYEGAKGAYYSEFYNKIKVIPQGFNFDNVKLLEYQKNKIPTFAYAGIVYKGKRDPTAFLDYLSALDYDFKFIVYTTGDTVFYKYKDALKDKLEIKSFIPREDLISQLSKMDFIINIKNESSVQLPSKLIDYTLTKRPILEISSYFNEQKDFDSFIIGDYTKQFVIPNINEYDIVSVAQKFIDLYNEK